MDQSNSAEKPIACPGRCAAGPFCSAESSSFAAQVVTEMEYHHTNPTTARTASRDPLTVAAARHGINKSPTGSPARQCRGSGDKIIPKTNVHIELQPAFKPFADPFFPYHPRRLKPCPVLN